MSFLQLYFRLLPLMTIYPTIVGIDIGVNINKILNKENSFNKYSNLIGYPSIRFITGITYLISY